MSTATVIKPEALSLLRKGWKLLIEQFGIQKATQFVMLLERGQGDSVKEIAEYWGNMDIEKIHQQVMNWKRQHSEEALFRKAKIC